MKKLILITLLSTLTGALSIGLIKVQALTKEYVSWQIYNYYEEYWGMKFDNESINLNGLNQITIPSSQFNVLERGGIDSSIVLYDTETLTTTTITFTELIEAGIIFDIRFGAKISFITDFFDRLELPVIQYDKLSVNILQSTDYNDGGGVPNDYYSYFIENGFLTEYKKTGTIPDLDIVLNDLAEDLGTGWKLIIIVGFIIILAIMLFTLKVPSFVIFLLVLGFVSIFYLLNWIPFWFILLIAIIMFILILLKILKGGND